MYMLENTRKVVEYAANTGSAILVSDEAEREEVESAMSDMGIIGIDVLDLRELGELEMSFSRAVVVLNLGRLLDEFMPHASVKGFACHE